MALARKIQFSIQAPCSSTTVQIQAAMNQFTLKYTTI